MTVFSWPTLKRWSNSTEILTIPVTGVKRVLGSYLGEGNAVVPLPDPWRPIRTLKIWPVSYRAGPLNDRIFLANLETVVKLD
jgi:hypothetical protein